ncbi:MAG: dual specificity protein phosphatase family protein [Firmicutes bacterium]|nr:dual specificity protein phosphatase family protein [Bacillota bacterium]
MKFTINLRSYLQASVFLLLALFLSPVGAFCQEKAPAVKSGAPLSIDKAKAEVEKFFPLIYSSGVTGKPKDQGEFHINRFLKNIGIIGKNDPDFATGLINHKLTVLQNFKKNHKQMSNLEGEFMDAFWGSFNIGVLERGRVYRNSQPSPGDISWYIKDAGFKTFINLRTEDRFWSNFTAQIEEKICKENGVVYKNFKLRDQDDPPPSKKEIEEVLSFIDKSPKPVMFHCAHGKGRTGMVAAAYRITRQGWKAEDAIKEAVPYGFRPEKMPNQVQVIKSFEK